MNAIVKSPFAWLLKREYWESRNGFLKAQLWTAGVLVAISILGILVFEAFRVRNNIQIGMSGNLSDLLNSGLEQNSMGLAQGLEGVVLSFGILAAIVLSFVVFFYLLGALYDDRRDRSILFWKSLPVSDTATVISKVVVAVVIAPVIAVCVVLVGYIAQQIVVSLWFLGHGLNPLTLIWAHTAPWDAWLHLLATIPVNAVWALPTVGWLLFWSAAVRSKPFLWATAIPAVAGLLNFWIGLLGLPHISATFFWGHLFARGLFSIVPASWMLVVNPAGYAGGMPPIERTIGTYGSMYATFLTPGIWIGAAVGIALIAAAIWFRRWRDEA